MIEIFETDIPQLTGKEKRNIYVYVPDEGDRFPVLYMFDGHNVFFDEDASFGKSWGMYDYLVYNNVPLIVVGVECNHHPEKYRYGGRLSEYSPFNFNDPEYGKIKGRGKITMDWFAKELKPYIDDNYPTRPERRYTFISGSSMGGLMTLYALCEYNDVFSRGAALSPSLSFSPDEVRQMIDKARFRRNTYLYMDYGEIEIKHGHAREDFANTTKQLLDKKVLLTSRIVPGGKHNEETWEKQVPLFMETLFYRL